MSEPAIKELQATVAALRAELDTVKAQIKDIHRAVKISDDDGRRHVRLDCHSLAIRTHDAKSPFAMLINASSNRGNISFSYPNAGKGDIAMSLGINEEGHPSIRLIGQDNQDRVLLTVEKDHGMAAFFAPDYKPGAVIRALPGGGSFAVLQPDGKARGLFYYNHEDKADDGTANSVTGLMFASGLGKTLLHLRADNAGSAANFSMTGHPGSARASIICRDGVSGLHLESAGSHYGVDAAAMPERSELSALQRVGGKPCSEATLVTRAGCASMLLRRPDGKKFGVEAHATGDLADIRLKDKSGHDAVELCHSDDLNVLSVFNPAGAKAIEIGATGDLARVSIHSPENKHLHAWFGATAGDVKCLILDGKRPLVGLSHSETGGQVTAYGSGENPGFAALCGQSASASVTISSADGTTLAGIGANDYGGQLTLNNDLGFPRLFMGTHEESSVITLNYTGQKGLALAAGPGGGFVTAHDSAGNLRASLPAPDDIEDHD